MMGGRPFRLPAGAWTDDASMALCLAASLAELGAFDPLDQMCRHCDWWEDGYLSSTGYCFDIGMTVSSALKKFQGTKKACSASRDAFSAGNGCIMRLAPVPMFFYPDTDQAANWAGESSRTTHGALECVEACQLIARMLCTALSGGDQKQILFKQGPSLFQSPKVRALASGGHRENSMAQIKGSGYVIDCLEAAAWCYWKTESFR